MVLESDPEAIGPFTDSFITDRVLIWDKMIKIFHGSDAWTYQKPAKKNHDGILGYKIISNHYLGPRNINHVAAVVEKKLAQCTYTG